jgi:proline iminopeptidase
MKWAPTLALFLWANPAVAQDPNQKLPPSQTIPAVTFHDGKVTRDGFDLFYRTAGTGRPVLVLAGGPGDDCDYMLPVAADAAKSAQAILLEQRGTGRSRPPAINQTTINLANYLDDLEALRIHLSLEQWTLVGHSAGGLLAMYYAAAHPDRVDKLILLDTAPIASEFLRPLQDNILDRLSSEERDQLAALEKSESTSPEVVSAMTRLQIGAFFFDRKAGAEAAAAFGNSWHADVARLLGNEMTPRGYDLRPRLKNFERPVLVLNGRQDPMDPLMAYETQIALKNSTLRFIDRSGHFPWAEQPQKFNEVLNEFLK